MIKEQIIPLRDSNGKLVAFYIYDMETRQTVMYSCELMGFDEIKDLLGSLKIQNESVKEND